MRAWEVAAVLWVAFAAAAQAAEPGVGSVKTFKGASTVKRGGESIAAREGLHLQARDVLLTGADGRLGLILNDGTRISIGPNTEISVDRFTYEPARGQLDLVLRMVRGVMVYVSGKIAELAPQSVRVETPVGILGLRGTRVGVSLEQP